MDGDGYPTNSEWLQQQGLDAATLNRELVSVQQQQQQFLDVLSDPQRLSAFMAEYQRQLGADPNAGNTAYQQYHQQMSRDFPGGSPGPTLYMPTSNTDTQYWMDRLSQINEFGAPPTAAHQQRLDQMWAEFPEQALMHLVQQFPVI